MPVDRLSNLMKKQDHSSIDLLKLEIEGAEYAVLDTIVQDKLDIKIILVEFDEVFHDRSRTYLFRIKKTSDKLRLAGYKMVHSTLHYKRTFIRNDIYKSIKK